MAEPDSISPVVIAPTYNNAETLGDIVKRIHRLDLPLIVVNDGSADRTADVLEAQRSDWRPEALHLPAHPRNRGKAAALHRGFDLAIEHGYSHAVTIDTDGQHDPEQIPSLLETARRRPEALVIGARSDRVDGTPARCLVGRRLTNRMLRLECGVAVHDSQSGMRVYPLGLIGAVPCRAQRFAFETEIIARSAWAGFEIIETPITSRYLPPEQQVSHFRPWVDTLRSIAVQARLLIETPYRRSRR
ncbi:MAG: hypothetical protein CMJ18_28125 [Phycisphaeraceae bacterium]|nr:hypothetical protein [Phycisphaeraceae bacterium]